MTIEKVDRTVERLLDALGLASVGAQARLARSWADLVGPLLAAKTCPARLRNGILTISAVSPAWAQELSLARPTVVGRIDALLGAGKVRDVRVVVGPVPGGEIGADAPGEPPPAEVGPGGGTPEAAPDGIESVPDPELRGILTSLSRKARGKEQGRS